MSYKIGFNVGEPFKSDPAWPGAVNYGDYVRQLDAAGIPARLMSVDGAGFGDIYALWEAGSTVNHTAVIRYMPPDGSQDVPRYDMLPADAAAHFWTWTKAEIGADVLKYRDRVWLKCGNELDKNKIGWLANFYVALWELMQTETIGPWRLVAFNFSQGEPEPYHWPAARPYLELCAAHPESAAVGLHQYSATIDHLLDPSGDRSLIGRFTRPEDLFDYCDSEGIARPKIFIHELGWRQETAPPATDGEIHLRKLDAYLQQYPEVIAAGVWTLKTWPGDVENRVNDMVTGITNQALAGGADPDPIEPPPAEKHKAIVVKLPQDCTAEEWTTAAAAAYTYRHTQTASHDDMLTILQGGNNDSYVKFSHPDRDAAAVALVEFFGYRWEPLYTTPPPPATIEIADIVNDLPKHETKTYQERPPEAITHIAIHHTVSPPDRSIESIAAYHVNGNDWPGIGYHYVINDRGDIYQTNYLTTKSYHVGSYAAPGDENEYTIGIALQGDFTAAPPPYAQQDAARRLVEHLRAQLPNTLTAVGHRHMPGAATACPGATWPDWLAFITGPEDLPQNPPAPSPPPQNPQKYDMTPYIIGDGRAYMVRNANGGTERLQMQTDGVYHYQTKNSNWREFYEADELIYTDVDTSPGNGRFYRLWEGSTPGAPWLPAAMAVSETFTRTAKVQFYDLETCTPDPQNSGEVTDTMKFLARYTTYTFRTGTTLSDVIELEWVNGGEKYFYARNYGLVGWERSHQDPNTPQWSAINDDDPGDYQNKRITIPCLS